MSLTERISAGIILYCRLKKVLEKKREAIAVEEADKLKKLKELAEEGVTIEDQGDTAFQEDKDEDVVFS